MPHVEEFVTGIDGVRGQSVPLFSAGRNAESRLTDDCQKTGRIDTGKRWIEAEINARSMEAF
jgi:hypothetical protein